LERYFEELDGPPGDPLHRAGPALRRRVSFGRLNLVEKDFSFQAPLDVIFCRNVMIYFDKATQQQLLARFHQALRPGGWLYTGLSESLLAVKHDFKTVGPSVYRKAL
jgi:chemotaxis protein methyltransferase CheR